MSLLDDLIDRQRHIEAMPLPPTSVRVHPDAYAVFRDPGCVWPAEVVELLRRLPVQLRQIPIVVDPDMRRGAWKVLGPAGIVLARGAFD